MSRRITDELLSWIRLDNEPIASQAFNRLAADHGERFAELARDTILAQKLLAENRAAAMRLH